MFRLRLSIVLFLLSWFPFAQIGLVIAHNNGQLTSSQASQSFRLVIWGVQILIGFVGLWLAGSIVKDEVKLVGWRRAPKRVWQLFLHGQDEPEV